MSINICFRLPLPKYVAHAHHFFITAIPYSNRPPGVTITFPFIWCPSCITVLTVFMFSRNPIVYNIAKFTRCILQSSCSMSSTKLDTALAAVAVSLVIKLLWYLNQLNNVLDSVDAMKLHWILNHKMYCFLPKNMQSVQFRIPMWWFGCKSQVRCFETL
jgi:hypothetical protein